MSPDELEDHVAHYLELSERDSSVSPEGFAAGFEGDSGAVLAAIRGALAVADLLAATEVARPEWVGPYRVLEELGRGATGIVWVVERDGVRYALKRWSPAWSSSARSRERFQREARTLARMDHPGIVRVHDCGVDADGPYLVMQLVQGQPLSQLALPVDPPRAARIVRDLARAVAAAHAAGVLHRDIKPQNVVLDSGDRPVLLDFGLVAAEGEDTLTATGGLVGTPRYMAPEQARGTPAGRRSDVFGLGLVLYELVFGRTARRADTPSALVQEAAWREVRLPARPAGVDDRMARILRSALAWRPERRLSGAAELADELDRWRAGEEVRARPPSLPTRAMDRARARPARLAWVMAVFLALLSAAGGLRLSRVRAEAAGRALFEERLDRALSAWFLGSDEVGLLELAGCLAIDPQDEVAVAIARALRGGALGGGTDQASSGVGPAIADLAAGDALRAVPDLARARERQPSSASLAALHARALSLAERDVEAAAALERARVKFPGRAVFWCLDALACQRAGRDAESDESLRRALALAPDSGPLHAERARGLLRAGRVAEGVEEAAEAARLHLAQGVDYLVELPRLLALSADGAGVRAELEARLEHAPDDMALWFALAWSRDAAHELRAAEEAYRRVMDLDPRCVRAALNLAHLHAGAQLGSCRACDEAYGREPGVLDPARALQALELALDVDQGRAESVVGRAVQTALDLERRAPLAGAAGKLLDDVQHLLAAGAPSAVARARLEDAVVRLRAAAGR